MELNNLENIADAYSKIMGEAFDHNKDVVFGSVKRLPTAMQRAVIGNYPTYLKRRSGNLVRSIMGFSRQTIADQEWEIGVVAGGEVAKYARILHEGGVTKPHWIAPRLKKALMWLGGTMVKGCHGRLRKSTAKGNKIFSKGHMHPGSKFPARPYIREPMGYALEIEMIKVKKKLGWKL